MKAEGESVQDETFSGTVSQRVLGVQVIISITLCDDCETDP